MTAKLTTHELGSDKTFEVAETGLTIGRHVDNQASLDDARLSRFHARIKFKDGAWYAEDLGSTNGSFLNGTKFEGEVKISSGDKLRFGATEADFVVEDAAAALPKASLEPRKTAVCPKPKDLPDPQSIKTDATIVAPLSSLIKDLPASAAAPSKPEAIKPISPVSPVAPASPLSPAGAPGIRKPIIGGVLKPGLKLPPKPAGLKPGLKLPPKPAGLKPGLKLPPKPSFQLKPGLKLPPKPGDAPAQ